MKNEKEFLLLCNIHYYEREMLKPFEPRPGSDKFSTDYQRETHDASIAYARKHFDEESRKYVAFKLGKHKKRMVRHDREWARITANDKPTGAAA